MSRASDPKWLQDADKATAEESIQAVFGRVVSHLASYLFGKHSEWMVSLSVRRRAARDYMAVLVRFNEDTFQREVVFGTGVTALGALVGLGKCIARHGWKRDKYSMF